MDRAEIASKAKNIIAGLLGVDEQTVSETSKMVEDLGADSLDRPEIVRAVEQQFSISVDNDEFEAIETAGQVIDLIFTKTR